MRADEYFSIQHAVRPNLRLSHAVHVKAFYISKLNPSSDCDSSDSECDCDHVFGPSEHTESYTEPADHNTEPLYAIRTRQV